MWLNVVKSHFVHCVSVNNIFTFPPAFETTKWKVNQWQSARLVGHGCGKWILIEIIIYSYDIFYAIKAADRLSKLQFRPGKQWTVTSIKNQMSYLCRPPFIFHAVCFASCPLSWVAFFRLVNSIAMRPVPAQSYMYGIFISSCAFAPSSRLHTAESTLHRQFCIVLYNLRIDFNGSFTNLLVLHCANSWPERTKKTRFVHMLHVARCRYNPIESSSMWWFALFLHFRFNGECQHDDHFNR